jgi:glycine/D-amino acid oxidase-like deaminating enzyme
VPLQSGARGLLIGATVEDAGFDERPTDEGRRRLFDAARQLLPSLTRDAIKESSRRPPAGDA